MDVIYKGVAPPALPVEGATRAPIVAARPEAIYIQIETAMRKNLLVLAPALLLLALLAGCAVNPVLPVTPVSPVGPYYVYEPYYYDYPHTYYLAPPVFGYYPYGSFGPRYYYGHHWGPRYGYYGGYHWR